MTPYRAALIANGTVTPAHAVDFAKKLDMAVLRLDDRGRAQAVKNIALGGRGSLLMEMPVGLGIWHEKALELREKRERAKSKKLN